LLDELRLETTLEQCHALAKVQSKVFKRNASKGGQGLAKANCCISYRSVCAYAAGTLTGSLAVEVNTNIRFTIRSATIIRLIELALLDIAKGVSTDHHKRRQDKENVELHGVRRVEVICEEEKGRAVRREFVKHIVPCVHITRCFDLATVRANRLTTLSLSSTTFYTVTCETRKTSGRVRDCTFQKSFVALVSRLNL